jgi:hypothetical protein
MNEAGMSLNWTVLHRHRNRRRLGPTSDIVPP